MLDSIKNRKPRIFRSVDIFHKVMAVLESHYFHHAMWNFAMNLFDKDVMRCIVLDEDAEGVYEAAEDAFEGEILAGEDHGVNGNE
jgi:hypothetical protein